MPALRKNPTSGGVRAAPGRKNPRAKIAVPGNRGIKLVRAVTVDRPAGELYAFWRRVENLARIVNHPVEIIAVSDEESHWSVRAPGRTTLEWDSVIINDQPERLIAWRSRDGAEVENAGSVRFEPVAAGGTKVTVAVEFNPPGGKLGALVARVSRAAAGEQLAAVLGRFKDLMENGDSAAPRRGGAGPPAGSRARRR